LRTWMAVSLIDTEMDMGMHQGPYQRGRSLATERGD
jgi:hypothetical protein